jgi:uncharacterized protein (TIGR00251 family)
LAVSGPASAFIRRDLFPLYLSQRDLVMRISVHATAGSRRNHVGGQHDGALRVAVTAPADKGRANKAIGKLLATALGISARQIELASGATNRRKVFVVSDPPPDLENRVAELAALG